MAKRSRRSRRQEKEAKVGVEERSPEVSAETALATDNELVLEMVHEYSHVYRELRNVLIITVLMFIAMVGLSFVF